jgi:hypothetical protein
MSQETNVPEPLASSSDNWPDGLLERIAQVVARTFNTPERPDHENYANFFVPPEIAGRAQEHKPAALHRNSTATKIHEVVEVPTKSSSKKDTFDPFTYVPFAQDPEEDPRKYPWPVPVLEIIEPSPPASIHGDVTPPASRTSGSPGSLEQKQKRSAGVTWGEAETHLFEVVPPLDGNNECISAASPSKSRPGPSPAFQTEKPPLVPKPPSKSQAKNRRQIESDYHEPARRALQAQCLDITQSKWVQDPNDPSEEIVSLTSFRTNPEAAGPETSFRWM